MLRLVECRGKDFTRSLRLAVAAQISAANHPRTVQPRRRFRANIALRSFPWATKEGTKYTSVPMNMIKNNPATFGVAVFMPITLFRTPKRAGLFDGEFSEMATDAQGETLLFRGFHGIGTLGRPVRLAQVDVIVTGINPHSSGERSEYLFVVGGFHRQA
jgi:hypothetical protein